MLICIILNFQFIGLFGWNWMWKFNSNLECFDSRDGHATNCTIAIVVRVSSCKPIGMIENVD